MSTIVFLQNAWSSRYAGKTWPRQAWLRALARSRSGQRLRTLIDDFSVCDNTTPIVGRSVSSVVPADDMHILSRLRDRRPKVVVACGRQAEAALRRCWSGPLLVVPHPAYRVVTNELYATARELLAAGLTERIALRQERGRIKKVKLS